MERHANLNCNCHPIHSPVPGFRVAVAAFAFATLFASPIHAAPDGGQVSTGTGSIAQTGTTTTITQQSQNLAIDWNTFSIAAGESVNFIQPNSSSIALNRILGTSPSEIYGSLSANGQVFILNPNGVLFGQGAQVNVGGLVASTLGLSNADFLAGNYRFSNGGSAGAVVNQGTITAADGGYIALLAPEVRNEGVISARLGTALLAAGDMVTLNLDNGSLLGFSVDQGTLNALAENRHLIQADGGQVFMSARAADALGTAVVNNTGIIEARTVQNIGGVIKLMGDMQVGQVNVGGTLDASAPNGGNGGFIETSAAQVNVANGARVTTLAAQGTNGTWLIDPFDFTIAAVGGNMTGADVSSALAGTDVTILSSNSTTGGNGDINVNDVVSWSANTLTLNAQRNININASMNGSGDAKLALLYGQGTAAAGNTSSYVIAPNVQVNLPAGPNFSTKLGSDGSVIDYTVITSLGAEGSTTRTDLQGMNGNLAGNYVLGSDIDACATSGCGIPANAWNAGAGFAPIGDNSSNSAATWFTGTFDGLGHTISNLTINWQASSYVGLFGYASAGSSIRNVGLLGVSVAGSSLVGGLVGYNSGIISNAHTTGNVTSNNDFAGGLAGYNNGIVTNSYSTCNVNGNSYVGGLIGNNYGNLSTSHATGTITGSTFVGGLVGVHLDGTISGSYATGNVNGNNAGGLVGQNGTTGIISGSYATGTVIGSTYTGGLVGINYGVIGTSYATGSVSGTTWAGGLVGYNTGTISTTYAAGSVSGTTYVGGLAGYNTGTISSSYYYWDATLPQPPGIGSGTSLTGTTALTTAQMMTMSSFSGWNIANTGGAGKIWRIYEGYTAPLLTSFLAPLTVTANSDIKTYDGIPYAGGNGVSYSVASPVLSGTLVYDDGTSMMAVNAGSYTIIPSGYFSNQQGYDIRYVNGLLSINPVTAVLMNITANDASKIYGTTLTFNGTEFFSSGLLPGDVIGSVTLNSAGAISSANAGSYDIVPSAPVFSVGNAANYIITYIKGTLTVIPASPAAAALGGNALVLAYNTAQQGIANTDARKASNPPGSNVEPIGIVGCGVAMPPDAPANTCQN